MIKFLKNLFNLNKIPQINTGDSMKDEAIRRAFTTGKVIIGKREKDGTATFRELNHKQKI